MQDEGVERYGGTKDVADSHKFDEKNLEAYLAAHVEGFEGPMEVRQFKGGQSNPTYQIVAPKKNTLCAANRRASFCPLPTQSTANIR